MKKCNYAITVRLRTSEGYFFGPGVAELLEGIEKTHSIKKAAAEMYLSYVKALKMIRYVENACECSIVRTWHGGSERGGAELTEKGREFLNQYKLFEKEIRLSADHAFAEIFNKAGE